MAENQLPKGWINSTLSEVTLKITDGTHKTPNYQDDGVRFISIKNIKPFKPINWEVYEKYISEEEHIELSKRAKVEVGDIVFPRIGTLGFAKIVDWEEECSIFVGLGLIKLFPNTINSKFMEYYLNSPLINELSHQKATGTGRLTLSLKESKLLPINLPPLAEQQRIVAKLDKLFAYLEETKTRLNKIPQLLKNFRQSVLTQAVTGKLIEFEPSNDFLKTIKSDREKWFLDEIEIAKKTGTKKPKKIVIDSKEDKSKLLQLKNEGLEITTIEEIAGKEPNPLKAGPFGSSLKKDFYVESGYKIYGQEQVIKNDPYFGDYYINQERFESLSSCAIKPNDILISLVGTIGKVLILPPDCEPGIINPRLVKITLHESVLPRYFEIFLKSNLAINQLKGMAHGGTMDVLNLGVLKRLLIPIPNMKGQEDVIKKVDSLMKVIDEIEAKYNKLVIEIENLPQSILAKAFKGELVEQLPTDGDAQELLDEIKKLKAQTTKKKK